MSSEQFPNPDCHGLVFVIQATGFPLTAFPAELKESDDAGLPESIRQSVEEAIRCHAQGCYRAAALTVRRTLEEMCQERGAKAPTYKIG